MTFQGRLHRVGPLAVKNLHKLTFPIYTFKKHIFLRMTSKSYQIHLELSRTSLLKSTSLKVYTKKWLVITGLLLIFAFVQTLTASTFINPWFSAILGFSLT